MGHGGQTLRGGSWLGTSRCRRHHSRIIWLACAAYCHVCLLNNLIVVDMVNQCCLWCKTEAPPVDINNLVQTVAHLTLNFCLGGYRTWDGFKNNLEWLRFWPPYGAENLFLSLRVKTCNRLDLIILRHTPWTWIIRVGTPSWAWWEGDVDYPRRKEIRRCMQRWR